ncbi:ral guanine nucleotide dissociation stimulator [Desmodus rotundus]|uniref:ral guanine nucleotide dissociation stimulator n=1 Tax=Desmodus rotundus TaxID=9430 RepID=UPI0023815A5F|nr:ral guanine nucleotide dissociation stimulator-like [Desmodus rotundus]
MHQTTDTSTCYPEALKGGTLKKVADVVAPAFLGGNISHLTTLRAMYQAFSRAQMFSDDLHSCYRTLSTTSERIKVFLSPEGLPAYNENGHSLRAIASARETWADQVQVFSQPLHFPFFHLKHALVQVNFPTSQQLCEAQLLWVNLEYPQPKDAMPEDPLPEFESNAHPQEIHALSLMAGPARGICLAWPGLMQCLKPGWGHLFCLFFLALLEVLSFILSK